MDESAKTNLSDEELMRLYLAGDFAGFEALYRRHSGRVYEYLQKKAPAETAQDLVQEVFEKLHKSRRRYDPQYPFLPWLFTIARNALTDFFRLAETRLAQASSGSEAQLLTIAAETESPSSGTGLAQILAGLPLNQRRAIELRYLQDWSFEQIASHMSTSESNARQLISRGLKQIRRGKGGYDGS